MTSDVEVTEVHQLSPTVKGYTLSVMNTNLTFYPGQWWVNLYEGISRVYDVRSLEKLPQMLNIIVE